MKTLTRLAVLALVCSGVACSGIKFESQAAPDIDFTKYQTYAWHPQGNELPDDPRYNGEIIGRRIEASTDKAMAANSLTKVAVEEADVLLVFHAAVDGRLTATQVNSHYGWDIWWGGWSYATTYQGYYEQGTVVLDVLENRPGEEDKLVFRGWATGGIEEKPREPDDMDRRMDKIMADIMADWPGR